MAEYLIQSETLDAIADAINAKTGGSSAMTPAEMATEIGSISSKETLSWHQCPEAVRNYLTAAQAAYPSNDNVTVIDQYAPSRGNEVTANTKPVGYTIDGVTFRDNEPLVATPFATTSKAGTLTALDKLRWYNTTPTGAAAGSVYPRGRNCRDLGGWACDGGTVRYGLLVRGSEPNPADKGLMVDKIGIRTEVQILPVSEQPTDYKMKSPWGIDWAGNDTNDSFYDGLTNKTLWKKLLTAIMDSVIHCKAVYFHCGVGADRTGIVAMCLLAILGVSKSDIDQDYELTNFDTGWQSLEGGIFRSRSYSSQTALNTAINAVPLANGLTDSYRNRWVSFVLSCGISIDKVNAFRAACIDGTPDVITVIVPTYTITKSGSHVAYDNNVATVNENDPYSVGVTPASGYVISDVSVTMGGVDITSQVFSGTPTVRRVSVANNLSHCTTSNNANVVDEGTSFAATITADEGYTLDGADVSVTMGGVDITDQVFSGTPTIRRVSVTNNLSHCATSNTSSVIEAGSSYSATITAANGYTLDGATVSIMMGNTDITASSYSNGAVRITSVTDNISITITAVVEQAPIRYYNVVNNLSNCSTNNASASVSDGSSYSATITAANGYTLDGATVSITMGGVDVSNYYSNGTINIPSVNGDIVITINAVPSARENVYDDSAATYNARIRGVGAVSNGLGRMVTGTIDISNISTLTIEGVTEVANSDNSYARIGLYSSSVGGETDYVGVYDNGQPTYSFDVASLKTQYPTATHARIEICLTYPNNMAASDAANLAIYAS